MAIFPNIVLGGLVVPYLDVPPGAASYLDLPTGTVIVPPPAPSDPVPVNVAAVITRTPATDVPIPPAFRVEYGSSQAGQNRLHQLADGGLDVSLVPAAAAAGTLTLLFATMADALACRAAHADLGVFTLTDQALPIASMRYVLAPGDSALQLAKADQADDGSVWQLSVAYQQVP